MAYNYSDDTFAPPGAEARTVAAAGAAAPEAPSQAPVEDNSSTPVGTTAPATSDNPQSASLARFNSCRWQQPAENGNAAFCTHREVKPYAGTTGFDSDAWCPDCQYYTLRRAPKKRSPNDEYTY